MRHFINTIFTILILTFVLPNSVFAQSDQKVIDYGNNKDAGNFININGPKQYYEIYGQGTPLVLIHGNGGNIGYMKPQIEFFAKKYMVIVMSTDRDIIREEHTVYIYKNIVKANLCILTGENHYVSKNNPDLFNTTVQKYLDEAYRGEESRQ